MPSILDEVNLPTAPSAFSLLSRQIRRAMRSNTHNDSATFEEISAWPETGTVHPQVITAFLNHFGRSEIEQRPIPSFLPRQTPTKLTIKEIFKVLDDHVVTSNLGGELDELDRKVSRWKLASTGVRGSAVTGVEYEVPRYPLNWDEDLAELSHKAVGTLIEATYSTREGASDGSRIHGDHITSVVFK